MSAGHTPGRLRLTAANALGLDGPQLSGRLKIHSPWIEDAWDGDEEADANMRRLTACWNACDLMPTEDIEQLASIGEGVMRLTVQAGEWLSQNKELLSQRDELLAALQSAKALLSSADTCSRNNFSNLAAEEVQAIDALITKVGGAS